MRGLRARIVVAGLGVPLCLAAAGVTPGLAQFSGGGANDLGSASRRTLRGPAASKAEPAPPVLPGTKAPADPAAASQAPSDMSPTDALFDAINRGDLAAARDAVNRGANLDGRNLLGLTPLELSVDLGRNEISFLLLSMRPEDVTLNRDGRQAAQRNQGQTEALVPRRAGRARMTAVPVSAEAPIPATPRLHAGDGGTPVPGAGFLGFDEGRRAR